MGVESVDHEDGRARVLGAVTELRLAAFYHPPTGVRFLPLLMTYASILESELAARWPRRQVLGQVHERLRYFRDECDDEHLAPVLTALSRALAALIAAERSSSNEGAEPERHRAAEDSGPRLAK